MRKFHAMLGAGIVCLVLFACQRPQPMPMVTRLPSSTIMAPTAYDVTRTALPTLAPASPQNTSIPTPTPTPSPPRLLFVSPVSTSVSLCSPSSGSAWRSWHAVQYPRAVETLLTDQDILWVGTAIGLFRIDPRIGQYTQPLSYETSGGVSLLLPLEHGRLWAEGDRGHFYYDGRQWFQVQVFGLADGYSVMLAMDRNGDLWIQRYGRDIRRYPTYRLSGHIPPGNHAWTATEGGDLPWNYTDECSWQIFTNGWLTYRSPAECQAQNQARKTIGIASQIPNLIAIDADGSIWRSNSAIWNEPTFTVVHSFDGRIVSFTWHTNSYGVHALAADPMHGVWIGTGDGLAYWDGENVRWLTLEPNLCIVPWPQDMTVDSRGTVWLGTADGRILSQSPGKETWTAVPVHDLMGRELGQPIYAVAAAPDGGLWATHGNDLFRVGGATNIGSVQVPEQRCFVSHLVAGMNSVWGLGECGILQFIVSNESWTIHHPGGGRMELVVIDSDGTVYAGGPDGLYAYTGSEWRRVVQEDVTAAAADRQGGLWIASREQGKLWYFKSRRLTPYGQQFGEQALWYLTVDNRNCLWAAFSNVLLLYNGKVWRRISPPLWDIDRMTSGPDGRIWVTGRNSWATIHNAIAVYDPAADKQP